MQNKPKNIIDGFFNINQRMNKSKRQKNFYETWNFRKRKIKTMQSTTNITNKNL